MPQAHIRMLRECDLDAVMAIEQSTSVNAWSRHILISCLERYQIYALTLDGKLICFAVVMPADIEYHLLNIAIDLHYQNQGYGQFFLNDLIQSARAEQAKELLLEVRVSNQPAIALYNKMGFTVIGSRKDYYQTQTGREDAKVLSLQL